MSEPDMSAGESLWITLLVGGLMLEREAEEGVTYGLTLGITQFGDRTIGNDGRERPAVRQTIVAETPTGRYYCVGDGKMTAGEQILWLDEYLQLKGVVSALTGDDA